VAPTLGGRRSAPRAGKGCVMAVGCAAAGVRWGHGERVRRWNGVEWLESECLLSRQRQAAGCGFLAFGGKLVEYLFWWGCAREGALLGKNVGTTTGVACQLAPPRQHKQTSQIPPRSMGSYALHFFPVSLDLKETYDSLAKLIRSNSRFHAHFRTLNLGYSMCTP